MDSESFYTTSTFSEIVLTQAKQLTVLGSARPPWFCSVGFNKFTLFCFPSVGTECFLAQMRTQKGELLERLSSARSFANMDDEENYSAASKAVRQVGG